MPLSEFQAKIALLLAENRTIDSHLAGGAALHFEPNSIRYSMDLDYFHDTEERVGTAFNDDRVLLLKNKYSCKIEMNQPGYIRCLVGKNNNYTKIEWAHNSIWRFMPVQKNAKIGYILDPVDLAINKLLALAGRDESRDFLDVITTHKSILPIGAQCWAACGKDPGFNPSSLLEILKRRGKNRPEDFVRLNLTIQIDLQQLKTEWLEMLDQIAEFIHLPPYEDLGCLYFSKAQKKFYQPKASELSNSIETIRHFGRPGGILPRVL